jgi:hypothetical protein
MQVLCRRRFEKSSLPAELRLAVGRWVELPPEHVATGFDGRRLFINDRSSRLSWAEVE